MMSQAIILAKDLGGVLILDGGQGMCNLPASRKVDDHGVQETTSNQDNPGFHLRVKKG